MIIDQPLVQSERNDQQRHLLYIMGPGRSGSTILGILLRNALRECDFYGELYAWPKFRGIPKSSRSEVIVFWENFLNQHQSLTSFFSVPYHGRLEHFRRILKPFSSKRNIQDQYREFNKIFLNELADFGETRIIIDSSHYPFRALELRNIDKPKVHLIYLSRDPGATIRSFAKNDIEQQSKSFWSALAYLLVSRLISSWVYYRYPRTSRIRVRFEALAADPKGTVEAILKHFGFVGIPLDLKHLDTGLIFEGNRIKELQQIAFKANAGHTRATGIRDWFLRILFRPFG